MLVVYVRVVTNFVSHQHMQPTNAMTVDGMILSWIASDRAGDWHYCPLRQEH